MGKPAEGFLEAATGQHERVWVILKTDGMAEEKDWNVQLRPATSAATSPVIEQKYFSGVIVRLYSRAVTQ
jgi:hypothetical protein